MKKSDLSKLNIPKSPGVYFWKDKKGEILYIGKATILYERVKSYFAKDIISTRGVHILDMVTLSDTVTYVATDTALEALLLETELIKKYKPKYNTREKDDKSYNCVVITKEDFPQVLLVRRKDIDTKSKTFSSKKFGMNSVPFDTYFGPYPSGSAIREALVIIRKIFPFRDNHSSKKDNYEFYRQIELSPDISNELAKEEYKATIKNLKRFFKGEKQAVKCDLTKKMQLLAKKLRFEEAEKVKRTIFALDHISDVALMKRDFDTAEDGARSTRIEAYDISHTSGKSMMGVMVVLRNGQPAKSDYRKFTIKGQSGADDPKALREVLERRFTHTEWQDPDIVVSDGGEIQKRVVEEVRDTLKKNFKVVSVVKDEKHRAKGILGEKSVVTDFRYEILLANSEAHRFSITSHKAKRRKDFLGK